MHQPKVLIIGLTWPEPNTTAAGRRMLQLIKLFQAAGYRVVFASTAQTTEYSEDLENIKVETISIRLNHSSFDTFLKELGPTVVVFDRFMTEEQFGWRVAENCPQTIRILDTEDLHSLRKMRRDAVEGGEEFSMQKWKISDLFKREIASIYRSDISLIISKFELKLLQTELRINERLLHYLPLLIDTTLLPQSTDLSAFQERRDFIWIGNGKHAPNIDSLLWLKSSIWPSIKQKLPDAELNIYGAYLPPKALQLNEPKKGFNVRGWVQHTAAVLAKARVNLAPLRYGAGLKGKLLDAMQNGTPCVTTTLGAEGFELKSTMPDAVKESATELAKAAVELYTNEGQWLEAQKRGIQLLRDHFNQKDYQESFSKKIFAVGQNLEEHRAENHLGAMLMHHSIASTKYMSKWIEEKNRTS